MPSGSLVRTARACRLLRELSAIQRANAMHALQITQIDLTGEQPYLRIDQSARPPLGLDLDYGTTRTDLRRLLSEHGHAAEMEPPEHDAHGYEWFPGPDGLPTLKHAAVLYELGGSADAFNNYNIGQAWDGDVQTITYTEESTDLRIRIAGQPWTLTARISTARPDSLIGLGYTIIDQITTLITRPSATQIDQMRHGLVILRAGMA